MKIPEASYKIRLAEIRIINDITQYTEYFRKKVSLLDLLANILALIANSFTTVRFILRAYSKNFNNFKIIENLLNRHIIKEYRINSFSSDSSDFEYDKIISKKESFYKDNNNNNIIKDDNDNNTDNNEEELSDQKIKKLRFFDFFFNNCYCCCKKHKSQKIIHICNKIVYKYENKNINKRYNVIQREKIFA